MGEKSDQVFIDVLDAAQEYMALQTSLADALRAGFLSLAQARYSMGADRVSALQLPALMTATARLQASDDGELALHILDPSAAPSSAGGSAEPSPASGTSSGSGGWAKPGAPAGHSSGAASGTGSAGRAASASAAETTDESSSGGGGAALQLGQTEAELEAQLAKLRLAAQQSNDIVQQLAAKYCTSGGAGATQGVGTGAKASGASNAGQADDDAEYAEVAPPGRPISWFGSLVAPSLRQAEAHFSQALQAAVQAANAQQRLRRGIDEWQVAAAAGAGKGAA